MLKEIKLLGVGLCLMNSVNAMQNGNPDELNGQNAGQTPLAIALRGDYEMPNIAQNGVRTSLAIISHGNQEMPNSEQSAVQAALAKMPTAAERAQAELKEKIEKRKAELAKKAVQAVEAGCEAYKKALAEEIVKGVKLKKTNTSEGMSDRLKLQIRVDLCLDRLNGAKGAFAPNSPEGDWLEGAIRSVEGTNSMLQLDDGLSNVVDNLLVRVNSVFTEKWNKHMEQMRRGMPLIPVFPMVEMAIRNIKIDLKGNDVNAIYEFVNDKEVIGEFLRKLPDLVFSGRIMNAGQLVDYIEANVKGSKALIAQLKKAILEPVR